MILDRRALQSPELAGYDLCIVGSGPAGMTVANELRGSGLRVLVLESGAARPTTRGDRLRDVRSKGIHVKDYSRERVLGGASTTWAGLSSPMDDVDLSPREYLHDSGWPLSPKELFAAYEEAAERYRFPALSAFDTNGDGFAKQRRQGDLQPEWREVEEKIFLAAAEPQNFGAEWRDLFEGDGFDLLLEASVVELLAEGAKRVSAARVMTPDGELRVEARAFVLAAGGIENARLLLLSKSTSQSGLGNEHDQVGRCFMNHTKNYYGFLRFSQPVTSAPYFFGCMVNGFAGYAGLRLPTQKQRELQVVNSYIRLEPIFPWTDSQGVEALVLFVKKSGAFFRFWKKRQEKEVVELRDYSETGDDSALQNARKSFVSWAKLPFVILFDLPRVLRYAYFRLSKARPKIRRARIRNFMEMEPIEENRVTLSSETDLHGTPLALAEHDCTERDRRSMVAVHEALAKDLERTGLGVLEEPLTGDPKPWPIDQDASHHMGTTRMGRNPQTSVVDENLRLHETENVWLAGGSVFPSSGCANPTFTLVALSIRLARHLKKDLAR